MFVLNASLVLVGGEMVSGWEKGIPAGRKWKVSSLSPGMDEKGIALWQTIFFISFPSMMTTGEM